MDEHDRKATEDGLTDEQAGELESRPGSFDEQAAQPPGSDGLASERGARELPLPAEGPDEQTAPPREEHVGERESAADPHYGEELEMERDEDGEDALESVTIEISGLSIYTHHGVSVAEREVGQRLVVDLRLDLGETDATATDRIEDTVDYAEVCQLVTLIAQQRSHRTLERLCSSIADRLIADYELESVWVKAAKPEPPIPLPVDEVSVELWREPTE